MGDGVVLLMEPIERVAGGAVGFEVTIELYGNGEGNGNCPAFDK